MFNSISLYDVLPKMDAIKSQNLLIHIDGPDRNWTVYAKEPMLVSHGQIERVLDGEVTWVFPGYPGEFRVEQFGTLYAGKGFWADTNAIKLTYRKSPLSKPVNLRPGWYLLGDGGLRSAGELELTLRGYNGIPAVCRFVPEGASEPAPVKKVPVEPEVSPQEEVEIPTDGVE